MSDKSEPIRMACYSCDTTEADGVRVIPDGWSSVMDARPSDEWWTHLGYCPQCQNDSLFEKGN